MGQGQHAYAGFVEERAKGRVRPGPILDSNGDLVGQHQGIHHFTIGQRKGLGVALGSPRFVTEIDERTGAIHLGDERALEERQAVLEDVVVAPGVSLPLRARTKVRYRHEGIEGGVEWAAGEDGLATVTFDEPVRALTRGQIAVFYDGDRVLGGGRIRTIGSATKERQALPQVSA